MAVHPCHTVLHRTVPCHDRRPYQYGYIAALELGARGSTKVSKYMTMGRFSHEFGCVRCRCISQGDRA